MIFRSSAFKTWNVNKPGYPKYEPVMFDMDLFGGKKGSPYQNSLELTILCAKGKGKGATSFNFFTLLTSLPDHVLVHATEPERFPGWSHSPQPPIWFLVDFNKIHGFPDLGSKDAFNPKDDKTETDAMVKVHPLECPKTIMPLTYTSVTLTRNLVSFRLGSLVWEL